MIGANRDDLRRFFVTAWRKSRAGDDLDPIERVVATIVEEHPEYHHRLVDEAAALSTDAETVAGAENPFLHMGMHIALQEQLGAGRPAGIREIYQRAVRKFGNAHLAEHRMMECLGLALNQIRHGNPEPDENLYIECLKRLISAD